MRQFLVLGATLAFAATAAVAADKPAPASAKPATPAAPATAAPAAPTPPADPQLGPLRDYATFSLVAAYNVKCPIFDRLTAEAVAIGAQDAYDILPDDRKADGDKSKSETLVQLDALKCDEPGADHIKKALTQFGDNAKVFWLARDVAILDAGDKAAWAKGLTKLDSVGPALRSALDGISASDQAGIAQLKATSDGYVKRLLPLVCIKRARPGVTCPTVDPKEMAFADYAVRWTARMETFGLDAAAFLATAAPTQGDKVTGLVRPSKPTDYYRFDGPGVVSVARACRLGEAVVYFPPALRPKAPKAGQTLKVAAYRFGGKDDIGAVTLRYDKVWTVSAIDPAVKALTVLSDKVTPCAQ